MSHSKVDTLVKMANQIGTFFRSQRNVDQAALTAEHLSKFWDPRMRDTIIDHVAHGGEGLDPVVVDAVNRLAKDRKHHAPHPSVGSGG